MPITMKSVLAFLTILTLFVVTTAAAAPVTYQAKDFSRLRGMKGFSDQALELHFVLYQGYVKNTNAMLETLAQIASSTPAYAEMKRRLGWEYNGMRLHELYFGNLGGDGKIPPDSKIAKRLTEQFGSLESWANDFKATGAMRGIGWVVLYEDQASGRLINTWINEHDLGHLAGGQPLLVMDVFEHAFIPDYGLKKGDYIEAFFQNIDWKAVDARLGK
ncbi:superoxide dismutase [Desulfobacca acetoxidans]|uniref:superoxide dismutase n=1 Tax=Desulfobacca acetoxidans (strain ATCC 700848 / DSM 11109 / ASRB2) TaxID=880072 RepID=F2NCX7_DESAR|nr:Fe-Mn family superoxide dismutase [Desulfobacca acetoxidans]AEB09551.1 Manganese/iron superoxide dismutase [Desulfobacca acetoxidans DSM 11109]